MYSVEISKIADQFNLRCLTPTVSLEGREVRFPEVNRPALQLAGYYEYFNKERVQVVGNVEYYYLMSLSQEDRRKALDQLFSYPIPCLILCRNIDDSEEPALSELAIEHGVPVFISEMETTTLCTRIVSFLSIELAPMKSMHGVMMDCFGEGVLIIGESGFGKSETALELVQRGHRLVADDVVEIRRISDKELLAEGAAVIRNMLELRGVGVINVKELYGVQSVRISKSIDMVVKLEQWQRDKQYDRMGLTTETIDILGNEVACYTIPLMAGRNVSMIIEAAALNHREKKMGHNAAEELRERVSARLRSRKEEQKSKNEQA